MPDFNIIVPSKPTVVSENEQQGVYEIDGLYPGYGHTLGNSLRRIILSSLPGFAITSLKIAGVDHEFSTIPGVKEDVITLILNLKRVHFRVVGDEPQTLILKAKGVSQVSAKDITLPGQVEIVDPTVPLATLTDKSASLALEISLEKGLGYVPKEVLQRDKVDIGTIAIDATFTPIRRVSYEVENMRVGDRTDFNKLRLAIETDGTITARAALEQAITIMIYQLKAIIGFREPEPLEALPRTATELAKTDSLEPTAGEEDVLKTRIEDLNLSMRTLKALSQASIRTVGGLARKKEADLLDISGLGEKGLAEIKRALGNFGLTLK